MQSAPQKRILFYASAVMLTVFVIGALILSNGCTISVITTHTQGEADDLIDQQQSAEPTISPNISIPASVI